MNLTRRSILGGAAGLAALTGLTACGGGREGTTSGGSASGASGAASESAAGGGFDAGSTIGISLPWLGTQNWKEAQDMFKEQLGAAGFKVQVQAADNKVAQQQSQIGGHRRPAPAGRWSGGGAGHGRCLLGARGGLRAEPGTDGSGPAPSRTVYYSE